MKTIELKWIEDDNHVVAEDAYTGLKELIETGVFPNLKVECKDDTLYITGEQEDLDKAVAKLQKSYIKYGQIAIRENHKKPEGIRIESYDANVQDIFNHTLNDFEEFKESAKHDRPINYITKLGQFQVKFNKFKEVAAKDDKKIIDGFLTEIETLEENADALSRIKPVKKKLNEDSLDDFKPGTNLDSSKKYFIMYARHKLDEQDLRNALINSKVHIVYITNEDFKIVVKNEYNKIKKVLKNLISFGERKTWGISFTCSNDMNAEVGLFSFSNEINNGLWYEGDIDKIMRILTDDISPAKMKVRKPRDPNKGYKKPEYINPDMKGGTYFDGDTQVYEMPEENESCKKLYNEEIKKQLSNPDNWGIIDENLLSPAEMKKKLQRVAAKWAYENGMKFDDAYNELRKKKSVKDMLDFYSVEEIIDDLKQKKTEEDDEIVESRSNPRKIKSRAELIRKAIKQDAIEIESWEDFESVKENQLMNELGYSMDINGNKTGAIWMGDKDGKMYYCTNPGILIRT